MIKRDRAQGRHLFFDAGWVWDTLHIAVQTCAVQTRAALPSAMVPSSMILCAILLSGCQMKGASEYGESPIESPYQLRFEGPEARDALSGWQGSWNIHQGELHTQGDGNAPLWLKTPLPENARISFVMTPLSQDVDLKVELYGDGLRHESGYIIILGGWKNTLTVIAEKDEHQKERFEKKTKWVSRKPMRIKIEHLNGTLTLWVNDEEVGSYQSPTPLKGPRHRYMAFNSWKSPGSFDDLRIEKIGEK